MRLLLVVLGLLAVGCRPDLPPKPTLILVSIDGFRADYLDILDLPTLRRLATTGVTATGGMLPVFPSKTFPNHYTIATGLYPARHGIVSNRMYDPDMDAWFSLSDRDAVEDPRWWGGEPIWVTAEKQGQTAAAMFWPGTEAPVAGVQPTYWSKFDASIPGEKRVAQVLEWLDLPVDTRPTFITLYFETVDQAGHDSGPFSDDAEQAALQVDAWLETLVQGIEERGGATSLLIVSDHGMAERSPGRVVFLDEYVDTDRATIISLGEFILLEADPEDLSAIREGVRAMPHTTLLDRAVLGEQYHYSGNSRIPSVVAIADVGWTVASSAERVERYPDSVTGGGHGYEPTAPDMRALFIASGPAFGSGYSIPGFQNIHLYNLMAHALDLDPAPNDGNFSVVEPVLAR